MTLKNKELWNEFVESNKDFYGRGVITYAERWANSMESLINDGANLVDIAEKTSREADTEGITGFMYGTAVSILKKCWIFGDELNNWHNKQYGYNGEGTVNPAVICVDIK